MQYYGTAEIIFYNGEHAIRQHREIELEYLNGDSTRYQVFILGHAKGFESASDIEIVAQGVTWHGRITGHHFINANNTTTIEFTASKPHENSLST